MAAPLREEWAAPKALCMCFQRSPDVDEHILSGLLDAAFYASRDTFRMLANHFYTLANRLTKFVFFSRQRLEDCNFCHHSCSPPFLKQIVSQICKCVAIVASYNM